MLKATVVAVVLLAVMLLGAQAYAAPSNVIAFGVSDFVMVNWIPDGSGPQQVYRAGPGGWKLIDTLAPGEPMYMDLNVEPDLVYYYMVKSPAGYSRFDATMVGLGFDLLAPVVNFKRVLSSGTIWISASNISLGKHPTYEFVRYQDGVETVLKTFTPVTNSMNFWDMPDGPATYEIRVAEQPEISTGEF